jgi:hypothetical protein
VSGKTAQPKDYILGIYSDDAAVFCGKSNIFIYVAFTTEYRGYGVWMVRIKYLYFVLAIQALSDVVFGLGGRRG